MGPRRRAQSTVGAAGADDRPQSRSIVNAATAPGGGNTSFIIGQNGIVQLDRNPNGHGGARELFDDAHLTGAGGLLYDGHVVLGGGWIAEGAGCVIFAPESAILAPRLIRAR
jgi:hypothetical protein